MPHTYCTVVCHHTAKRQLGDSDGSGECGGPRQSQKEEHDGLTLVRAFWHLTQAFRVTDSRTLRRVGEEALVSAGVSLSPRERRDSDVVWLGLLPDALLCPNEG